MVTRTHISVTFTSTLPVLLLLYCCLSTLSHWHNTAQRTFPNATQTPDSCHYTSKDPSSQYQQFLPNQFFVQHAQPVLPVRSASSDTYRKLETDNNNDHGLLRSEKLVSPPVTMYVCNYQLSVLTTPNLTTKQAISLLESLFAPKRQFLFAHQVLCQPLRTACMYFGPDAHTTCHRMNT